MWVCKWMVIGKWQECSSSALVLHLSAAHLTLIESVCRWTKHPHWPLAYPLLFLDYTLGRLLFALQPLISVFSQDCASTETLGCAPLPHLPLLGIARPQRNTFPAKPHWYFPCVSAFPPKILLIVSWLSSTL